VSPTRRARVFISFDYEHDRDLKNLLVGQARNEDTPFVIEDWSIKHASRGWKAESRTRIARIDQVIVICGHHTHQAAGVEVEVKIARELGMPYFLLRGRKNGWIRRPQGTGFWEKVHPWTWDNLRALTVGAR
jgi:hypothetical protein